MKPIIFCNWSSVCIHCHLEKKKMKRKGDMYCGSIAFAWHAQLWEGISSAGSCLQCQLWGAGYIRKAGPALVSVEEAFSVELNESRTSPLACCLPASSEDGGRQRKQRWQLHHLEQTYGKEKSSDSTYARDPPSYLCLLLQPIAVFCCHLWTYYVPNIKLRSSIIGEEISISSLATAFFPYAVDHTHFHLPTSPVKWSK